MTLALFLLDSLPEAPTFSLTGEEGRHAARVRRIGVGEQILVSDGRGEVAECSVTAVLTDGLALQVLERSTLPLPAPRLVVVQALPKGERAELAVETMTELGVDEIVPWAASRSVVQWQGERGTKALAKWRRTAREAAKQSRRAWVPVVSELASTAAVARRLAGTTGLVLHEAATVPLAGVTLPTGGEVVIVVGPEGGISSDELAVFDSAGAVSVRLGEPVLRTSTAGPAALAALSLRLGRWG
ncbi:16S rRNA (uracil(1498)-N(3))-methyltransferase [Jatrophihabitans sp.]|uniref:16S rRNA (uracil(1498)-N(3))-methyltransferase n=1 Tax=Jatrophihabitans sp. TaxID=1932789 RepID=UPI0030C6F972|nr:ribosomal small subunit methyltransferase [Jatrophihabitans sp.]